MKVLLTHIQELLQVRPNDTHKIVGAAMKELPTLKDAWLLMEDGVIADFGSMDQLPNIKAHQTLNCEGKIVLPTWCDSHTHLVYAGNREQEFVDRINGFTYQEIAERGGGILNSANLLRNTSEEELFQQASIRLEAVMRQGTGAIEIKSGYGLNTESELKMLRVAKTLNDHYPAAIKTTFLAAHAVPSEYKNRKQEYLDLICEEMLPKVAANKLADFVDIFCEDGYFSVADTHQLLSEAKKHKLIPKIHVNQFNAIGGVQAAVEHQALSVDHLEILEDADISALKNSETMPVALPACSFFLGIPYTPAKRLIDAGLPVAIATDYNPGSSPTGNMHFVISAACIKMKLTPEEAINAATINGAYAMGLEKTHGSITKGKVGSVIITKKIPSYGFIPYSFGNDLIDQVIINGELL